MSFDFGSIMAEIQQEQRLKNKWLETTPNVLVKKPAFFRRGDRRYTVTPQRLGDIQAFEISFEGPRGGKRKRKNLGGPGGGTAWKNCEVRLATPEVMAKLGRFSQEIRRLHQEREEYLRSVFWELEGRLTWDDIQEGLAPWREFKGVLSRFKKGKATEAELRKAMEDLVPR